MSPQLSQSSLMSPEGLAGMGRPRDEAGAPGNFHCPCAAEHAVSKQSRAAGQTQGQVRVAPRLLPSPPGQELTALGGGRGRGGSFQKLVPPAAVSSLPFVRHPLPVTGLTWP